MVYILKISPNDLTRKKWKKKQQKHYIVDTDTLFATCALHIHKHFVTNTGFTLPLSLSLSLLILGAFGFCLCTSIHSYDTIGFRLQIYCCCCCFGWRWSVCNLIFHFLTVFAIIITPLILVVVSILFCHFPIDVKCKERFAGFVLQIRVIQKQKQHDQQLLLLLVLLHCV